ncbi:hypothetical protein [Pseudonocardia sp. ICBG601]|uniref:non-homologous end-joining DNA ligase LigD n=1 Tax=Pseudonocardia sp. ICBG601 TaxID=2846759 RepID=UPI0027E29DB3|nr:hypothetical protein [Pseudonocardia sp. ICBG601]
MQKNLPRGAPDWIPTVDVWAESSQRTVHYPLCHDRRTLLWFGNQRAVEFHPTLVPHGATTTGELVIDLDPPDGAGFDRVVAAARARSGRRWPSWASPLRSRPAVRPACTWWVPLSEQLPIDDAFAATRAVCARAAALAPDVATTAFIRDDRGGRVFLDPTRAGGATLAAPYSPRARPGLPRVVPPHLGRAGRGLARRLHGGHRGRSARRAPDLVGAAARTRVPAGGAAHRGPGDPGAAGRGHARGEAPQARPRTRRVITGRGGSRPAHGRCAPRP